MVAGIVTEPVSSSPAAHPGFDFETAIRIFDETTAVLASQVRRLEEVLTAKQAELVVANQALTDKVAELDRLTAWLNLVMGSVASGVIAIDLEGQITTCNEAACAALAGEAAELLSADYRSLFPATPLLRVLDHGGIEPAYERFVRGPDGRRRILRGRASPLRSPQGTLLGAVEVFDDITETVRLRERAERASRLKQLGEMAAGVAHEIRNPLNGIEGFASLLARDLPPEDKRHRYATLVIDGVRDLNRTVSGLLEFTKPRRLERKSTDPRTLAAGVVELVAPEAGTVTLTLEDRWQAGEVLIDPSQIKQVLLNLVQNALHAVTEGTPRQGGRVQVTLAREGESLVLLVDDDGPGVPAAERQRIFTPFHTTRENGTGLGLAVAHAIVSLHGGSVAVEDSDFGGARFRLVLPPG